MSFQGGGDRKRFKWRENSESLEKVEEGGVKRDTLDAVASSAKGMNVARAETLRNEHIQKRANRMLQNVREDSEAPKTNARKKRCNNLSSGVKSTNTSRIYAIFGITSLGTASFCFLSTSQHASARLNTSQHVSARLSTSQHASALLNTPQLFSAIV
ncbi:hypothetical protein POVWA2_041440 [Plasmodium ovale wallikeri]|uniref:Uncharacterized protein n=1 Tax=Plasmodium ovale wallikeri TaxID=864142 RepID=A0A1A8ZAI7_PLAOA|nr:hypothetical protein POVWA1_042960 [Plasmodium ovale wallikeri]SBT41228.1 hypothetical protein POVWA2_041440 [Plasmodium ovale wallikeri]